MTTASPPGRTCPNCRSFVPQGRTRCPSCKMEASAMDAFAAAQRAAQKRGIQRTEVNETPRAVWISPKLIVGLVALALVGGAIFYFTRPGPPPWLRFPTTREEVVQQLLADISKDDDASEYHAYGLIALEVRDKDDSDESGKYRQIFHIMHNYLGGEFGADWLAGAKMARDPNDSGRMIVSIGLETLHVRVSQQTPADQLGKAGAGASEKEKSRSSPHYGIAGIDEFDISQAAGFQQWEAILGVVRVEGGETAANNIRSIVGALGGGRRKMPMQIKVGVLPLLRNPHDDRDRLLWTVIQTWPVRKDPVIRARLTAITADDRFAPDIKAKAKQVLDETVPEEELIRVGVD